VLGTTPPEPLLNWGWIKLGVAPHPFGPLSSEGKHLQDELVSIPYNTGTLIMTTKIFSPDPFNNCFEAASASLSSSITALEITALSSRATAAKATAYCPYSNFRVGCSLLTSTGEFVDGANVENAVYSVGMCAEMVAIGKAVSGNPPARKFRAVGVAMDISPPTGPCGMCRQ
jgi:homotetrameric cytidine deaminase